MAIFCILIAILIFSLSISMREKSIWVGKDADYGDRVTVTWWRGTLEIKGIRDPVDPEEGWIKVRPGVYRKDQKTRPYRVAFDDLQIYLDDCGTLRSYSRFW